MSEGAAPAPAPAPTPASPAWVQFDEEPPPGGRRPAPAVLAAETVQVNLEKPARAASPQPAAGAADSAPRPPVTASPLRTVRQGFANGDVVVTLLPVNTRWPWVTPAQFRPELVPEELMAQGLTLTVEEYVHAMELLVNDFRFTLYNVCYKRVLVCWIFLAFVVLMSLLFSGFSGMTLFSFGLIWLFLNAAAICICMWLKLKLAKGLEKCLGRVNKQLLKHKLAVTLDDRGKMSCHKVNLCFMFFDSAPCIAQLQQAIDRDEGGSILPGWERRLDVQSVDIVIQGSQSTRLSRRQERATNLYLRYLARWAARALGGKIDVTPLMAGLHSAKYRCPCQFITEHLLCKPPGGISKFCPDTQHIAYIV